MKYPKFATHACYKFNSFRVRMLLRLLKNPALVSISAQSNVSPDFFSIRKQFFESIQLFIIFIETLIHLCYLSTDYTTFELALVFNPDGDPQNGMNCFTSLLKHPSFDWKK